MSALKRIPIKYLRDRAKTRYKKGSECYVCASNTSLEFHHLYTVDVMFDNWLAENELVIKTAEDIINVRDDFIESHIFEMFEYARTLCKTCHKRLHTVYGQRPALSTGKKQERWLDIQRKKKWKST